MTLPSLLLVRVPAVHAAALATNEYVTNRWRIIMLDVDPAEPIKGISARYCEPWTLDGAKVEERVTEIVRLYKVSHAIVLTPLSQYGMAAWKVLAGCGVDTLWGEVFPDGKLVLDRLGCQYTARNEIALYEDEVQPLTPELPIGTRFPQPQERTTADLWTAYGREAIVVFGQVPCDHSLLGQEEPGYDHWLDLLFRANPETKFLFKQHPAVEWTELARTKGLDEYPNVREINESIHSLFSAYDTCAAYGSTTILEGVSRHLAFVTGGRHFVDSDRLVIRMKSLGGAVDLWRKLRAFQPDEGALKRRLGFLTRYYALRPEDPRIADRLIRSSDDYFRMTS